MVNEIAIFEINLKDQIENTRVFWLGFTVCNSKLIFQRQSYCPR